MLLNCIGEDSWEFLGQQGDQTQSILKEINPEYSLEGLMLKLKLQNFGHLMWKAYSLEKTLMLGKIEAREEGERRWDGWIALSTQWTWVWANSGKYWRTGKLGVLQSMGSQRVGHDLATGQQQATSSLRVWVTLSPTQTNNIKILCLWEWLLCHLGHIQLQITKDRTESDLKMCMILFHRMSGYWLIPGKLIQ